LSNAELLERLRAAGVDAAAQVRNVPMGGSFSNREVVIDGVARTENVNFNAISDQYFSTMGSALLAGRDFGRRDSAGAPRVAIVTQSFARVFFNGANPIGRTFQLDEPPGTPRPSFEIVGLARDSKYGDMRDPFEPLMYVPVAQDDLSPLSVRLLIRSSAGTAGVLPAVTALARGIHPASVVSVRTMESQLTDGLLRERLMATLSGFFGLLAALIATIGLYGVLSYSVARRRNEIGIRMALGADRHQVVRMVMREAGLLLAVGLAVGTVSALAVARSAQALLFGLAPHDPVTIVTAAVALAAVATVASYVPARRASRLEPTEALRDE
jgi:predicted permease